MSAVAAVIGLGLAMAQWGGQSTEQGRVRLQEGVGGYVGTQDTWIDEGAKDTQYGASNVIIVDDDTSNSFFNEYQGQGIIRFDGLFQPPVREGDPAPTRIPQGATILSARMIIELADDTELGDPEYYVHRMIRDWNEQSTWNSLQNGIVIGQDCDRARLATFKGDNNPDGVFRREFSIKPAVEAWSAGQPNYGVCILPQRIDWNDDGIEIRSSESGNAALRPAIDVDFTYRRVNGPPVVTKSLESDLPGGFEGDSVTFTVAARDPNPLDPLTFRLNGVVIGQATGSGEVNAPVVLEEDGTYEYEATVTDDEVTVRAGSVLIFVFNAPPRVDSLDVPKTAVVGRPFAFSARVSDPGRRDVLTTRWDFNNDFVFDEFTGTSGQWTYSTPGLKTVRVEVRDDDGGLVYAEAKVRVLARGTPAPDR
jgi:hypothetical protein